MLNKFGLWLSKRNTVLRGAILYLCLLPIYLIWGVKRGLQEAIENFRYDIKAINQSD